MDDMNRRIEEARRAQREERQRLANQAAAAQQRASTQRSELEAIGKKFVRWVRQSGITTRVSVPDYEAMHAAVPPAGKSKRARRAYRTPQITKRIWILEESERYLTESGGPVASYSTHIYLAIDEHGTFYPDELNTDSQLPNPDSLTNSIAAFIARSGSTVPWPD